MQRNFDECISASQTNLDPAERVRHNEPKIESPVDPGTRDLGYFVREMANTMRTWSFQLHHMSDQLIRDDPLPEKNSEEYQTARRMIQVKI